MPCRPPPPRGLRTPRKSPILNAPCHTRSRSEFSNFFNSSLLSTCRGDVSLFVTFVDMWVLSRPDPTTHVTKRRHIDTCVDNGGWTRMGPPVVLGPRGR